MHDRVREERASLARSQAEQQRQREKISAQSEQLQRQEDAISAGNVVGYVTNVQYSRTAAELARFLLAELGVDESTLASDASSPLLHCEIRTNADGRSAGAAFVVLSRRSHLELLEYKASIRRLVFAGRPLKVHENRGSGPRKRILGDRPSLAATPCASLRLCALTPGIGPSTPAPRLPVLWECQQNVLLIADGRRRKLELLFHIGDDSSPPMKPTRYRASLPMKQIERPLRLREDVSGRLELLFQLSRPPKLFRGSVKANGGGVTLRQAFMAGGDGPWNVWQVGPRDAGPREASVDVDEEGQELVWTRVTDPSGLFDLGDDTAASSEDSPSAGSSGPHGGARSSAGAGLRGSVSKDCPSSHASSQHSPSSTASAASKDGPVSTYGSVFSECLVYHVVVCTRGGGGSSSSSSNNIRKLERLLSGFGFLHESLAEDDRREATMDPAGEHFNVGHTRWPVLVPSSATELFEPFLHARPAFHRLPFRVQHAVECAMAERKLLRAHITRELVTLLASVPASRAMAILQRVAAVVGVASLANGTDAAADRLAAWLRYWRGEASGGGAASASGLAGVAGGSVLQAVDVVQQSSGDANGLAEHAGPSGMDAAARDGFDEGDPALDGDDDLDIDKEEEEEGEWLGDGDGVGTAEDGRRGPPRLVRVRSVTVTPLCVVPQPPVTEVSNRLLRLFGRGHLDRFLRLNFAEEGMGPVWSALDRESGNANGRNGNGNNNGSSDSNSGGGVRNGSGNKIDDLLSPGSGVFELIFKMFQQPPAGQPQGPGVPPSQTTSQAREGTTHGQATGGVTHLPTDMVGRMRRVLTSGIRIGGRHFTFLGYSDSQLKSQSMWMFCAEGADESGLRAATGHIQACQGDLGQVQAGQGDAGVRAHATGTGLTGLQAQLFRTAVGGAARGGMIVGGQGPLGGEIGRWKGAPPLPCSVDDIWRLMGDLTSIRCPGRYASRMGQCFSTTVPTMEVPDASWGRLAEVSRDGYCFSDGIGVVTPDLAARMAAAMGLARVPCAFQVRFKGCKGMLAVWGADSIMRDILPGGTSDGGCAGVGSGSSGSMGVSRGLLDGCGLGQYSQQAGQPLQQGAASSATTPMVKQLWVRASMDKFTSQHAMLEVVDRAKYIPCYLNRQLIVLLTALGVPDDSIWSLQQAALRHVDDLLGGPPMMATTMTNRAVLNGYLYLSDVNARALSALTRLCPGALGAPPPAPPFLPWRNSHPLLHGPPPTRCRWRARCSRPGSSRRSAATWRACCGRCALIVCWSWRPRRGCRYPRPWCYSVSWMNLACWPPTKCLRSTRTR
eukprot:jgi/Mesvir1/19590/Mv09891-RA.1